MSRTMQDVQREYQQAALELGAESYKVFALNQELELADEKITQLMRKMLHLNKEASRLAQPKGEPVELPAELCGPASVVEASNEQPQS